MARQTPGNYVPLDVNYARDAAIRKAGTNAELLYLRSLAYAKGARTSGFVPDFDLEVVAVGMRSVRAAVDKLLEVGLWVRLEEGWGIRSWMRWNAEEAAVSAAGTLGNHVRWHVQEQKSSPLCPHCTDRTPIAPRSHPESQGKGREGKERTTTSGTPDQTAGFAEFYAAYPRREARRKAEQAWRSAIKRAAPEVIMAGLAAFPFKPERQYQPLPASWLNADRWADEAQPAVPAKTLTATEVENVLGPDVWSPPAAPQELTPDERWEWTRQRQVEHIAARREAARARLGRTA